MLKIILPVIAGASVFVVTNNILNKKCDCKSSESIALGESINSHPCFGYSYMPLLGGAAATIVGYLIMSKLS